MAERKAWLYLEDGTVMEGRGFGGTSRRWGEVVFTTAMNGYPESLTDPSYLGQILIITHPLVGNYGVPSPKFLNGRLLNFEAEMISVEGLIVSELTEGSNYEGRKSLESWFMESNVPGLSGIDTRELVKKIRDNGVMRGIISQEKLYQPLEEFASQEPLCLVKKASVRQPIEYAGSRRGNIVIVDLGAKQGIVNCLADTGYTIVKVPYDSDENRIMNYDPVGIVYSNGPGNPNELKRQAEELSKLLERNIPTLGICLGHQVAVLALGGEVEKMKYGHRAINKAVLERGSGRSYITTHNHGYAASGKGIDKSDVWFVSPDDGIIEGLRRGNLMTTQFHPEARPGPRDTEFVFGLFEKMIENARHP